jgi:hypothetical protein
MKLLEIRRARNPLKKLEAAFDDGRVIAFGAAGYGDYIQYHRRDPLLAAAKRRAYLKRHGAAASGEDWARPDAPGSLARWILWETPDLDAAIAAYRRRFGV